MPTFAILPGIFFTDVLSSLKLEAYTKQGCARIMAKEKKLTCPTCRQMNALAEIIANKKATNVCQTDTSTH